MARLQIAKHKCRDCAKAYDFHSKNVKGEFILCRCPHIKEYSMLVNHEGCDNNFKPKKPSL